MNDASLPEGAAAPLAPWLQTQLEALLAQRGHAWLLGGPSGLGQFDLALALARAWLCEAPTAHGACGHCGSCHAVEVHTHADLCMLLPETLSLSMGWPQSVVLQGDMELSKLVPQTRLHTGLVWAVSLAVILWALLRRTVPGFDIRAAGANARAAAFAGVPITRTVVLVALLSGGLAGLMLEPGARISHAAVALAARCGTLITWVGEAGVRL